ncbi:MAG: RDD family protein [Pirellula sp.]|nr:RDD family protein [Pirellula sp.]
MSTTSTSSTKPVFLEYRCGRCWNSNCAETTQVGSKVPCSVCGSDNEVPEATIDRIERAEALISDRLAEAVLPLETVKTDSQQRKAQYYSVPTEEELIAQARAATLVPLRQRDFKGYANASSLSRIGAFLADLFLYLSAIAVGLVTCIWMSKQGWVENPLRQLQRGQELTGKVNLLVTLPFWMLQIFQWGLITIQGQTIGKYLLGIRIVSISGRATGFLQAVLVRSLICNTLSYIIPFYFLINCVLIFSNSKRCLHDYISGTRVVNS